jgi:hypothetical protein
VEAEFIDQLATGHARENPNAAIAASMLEKGGPDALARLHRLAASAERAYHRNYNAFVRERREQRREQGRQLEAAAYSYIFAPLPGRERPASTDRQNEPNRPAPVPPLRPAHGQNEANRDTRALRL